VIKGIAARTAQARRAGLFKAEPGRLIWVRARSSGQGVRWDVVARRREASVTGGRLDDGQSGERPAA
jgi:hypothetical protein